MLLQKVFFDSSCAEIAEESKARSGVTSGLSNNSITLQ